MCPFSASRNSRPRLGWHEAVSLNRSTSQPVVALTHTVELNNVHQVIRRVRQKLALDETGRDFILRNNFGYILAAGVTVEPPSSNQQKGYGPPLAPETGGTVPHRRLMSTRRCMSLAISLFQTQTHPRPSPVRRKKNRVDWTNGSTGPPVAGRVSLWQGRFWRPLPLRCSAPVLRDPILSLRRCSSLETAGPKKDLFSSTASGSGFRRRSRAIGKL